MKKIGIVIGTRPEAIKLLPLYFALKENSGFTPVIISTGQHREMLMQVLNFYAITPDYSFEVMEENQSLTELSSRLLIEFNRLLSEEKFDLVVVQGDTTSAFIGGLSAYYHRIPVAHVEAGLRTGDKYSPFPEEVNRKAISAFSTLNYAPTNETAKQLEQEGVLHVETVGNTVIDSLHYCQKRIVAQEQIYLEKFAAIFKNGGELIAITAHRRENFGDGLVQICAAIRELSAQHPNLEFAFPVHMNPSVNQSVHAELGSISNVHLLPPLGYDDWVFIMGKSRIILTDSGGIQEEAPALNIPVLVMRDNTERPEGVQSGCAVIAGTNPKNIVKVFNELINNEERLNLMRNAENPYGDGRTVERIIQSLENYFRTL